MEKIIKIILTQLHLIIPTFALFLALVFGWHIGINTTDIVMLVIGYSLTKLGVKLGFHRLLTHRSFKAVPAIRYGLAILGSMAMQGPVFEWIANHRVHHGFSDTESDVHSPRDFSENPSLISRCRAFWHGHLGWMFGCDSRHAQFERLIPDLLKDKTLVHINQWYLLWMSLSLALPALIGGLMAGSGTGALLGFFWGGLVRIALLQHVTWGVSSICHTWGNAPYPTKDNSKNNMLISLLAFGEGWHNNHHAFPRSARHGLRWYQIDFAYYTLWILARMGAASDVVKAE